MSAFAGTPGDSTKVDGSSRRPSPIEPSPASTYGGSTASESGSNVPSTPGNDDNGTFLFSFVNCGLQFPSRQHYVRCNSVPLPAQSLTSKYDIALSHIPSLSRTLSQLQHHAARTSLPNLLIQLCIFMLTSSKASP